MNKLKDIQQLINERAEKKLNKDLADLREYLHTGFASNLLELGSKISVEFDGRKENLRNALWSTDSPLFKLLKEAQLPKYIETETRGFINKIDAIREDVDELMNNRPNDY